MAEDESSSPTPTPAASQSPKLASDNGLSRVARLRAQMERTTSENIREEGKELQQAVEQSLNVILDLTLDGNIRWLSPTWTDVVGTEINDVQGRSIADLLVDDKTLFADALTALRSNDASSKVVRFTLPMGPKSRLRADRSDLEKPEDDGEKNTPRAPEAEQDEQYLSLEAQGILAYDRSTGEESHVSLIGY